MIEKEEKPRIDIWEIAPLVLAAILTLCAIMVCFFSFTVNAPAPPKPAEAGEISIGIPAK